MSSWGFLSKAEGFLDRVLEEQSKERSGAKRTASGTPTNAPSRPVTPSARWQDRLSRAASQFASTESLPSVVTTAAATENVKDAPVEAVAREQDSRNGAGKDIGEANATLEPPKTELQMSRIFPPNMPSSVDDERLDAKTSIDLPASSKAASNPIIETSRDLLLPRSDDRRESFQSVRSDAVETQPSPKPSVELPRPDAAKSLVSQPAMSNGQEAPIIAQLQSDMLACENRRVEEAQISAERISALERRLAYFSDESLSMTREIAQSSGSTAQQKLLAEKDARIAILLEEGDMLSKKELQHLANNKKLRSRVSELETLISTSLKAVEKAGLDNSTNKNQTKELQDSLKRSEAKVKDLSRMEGEVGDLKAESQVKSRIISDLKRQLADADDTISQNVTIWTQLQAEKTKTESLQKRIGALLTEAKATAEENASDMAELQGKFDRLVERSAASDLEKANEITRLEGELEVLRASLEETTTNASENSQAKLLRQIESLQTQQSLARQNWARIEESLVMRSNHAEKERDELREQEDELRNRLRQAVLLRKGVEEERGIAQSRVRTLESTTQEAQDQTNTLLRQLEGMKKDLENERQARVAEKEAFAASLESRIQERLLEERQQTSTPHSPYLHDMMSKSAYSFQRHIPDSPNMTRTPEIKRPGMHSRAPTQSSRVPSRRKTSQYSFFDDLKSPPVREDDPFDQEESASQLRPHTELSVSTASAGASVGMMERVSANVRKLELEMNILREDLIRMTRQRDEARSACVDLESLEQERDRLQASVAQAAAERQKVQGKFEATLELLGEQTEENEQLREDIADMRKAFKESLATMGL